MLLTKFRIITAEQANDLREKFLSLPHEDGLDTAGSAVKSIKNNRQITPNNKEGNPILASIANHIMNHKTFKVLTFPKQVARIMTNIHGEGEYYGKHVDNTLISTASGNSARADISFTLFLTDPKSYEGGALKIWTSTGEVEVKGEPGEIVVYDSGLLHEVMPVSSGIRVGTVGWIQSWIPDARMRENISEFDIAISKLRALEVLPRENQDQLHKIYNAFLRMGMR